MTTSRAPSHRPDAGISLIETVVSITVLALALTGIGPMMLTTARSSNAVPLVAQRSAAMAATARRYSVLSYDQLVPGTTCRTVSAEPFPHSTCTTITAVSATFVRIRVVVTPNTTPAIRPDTVVIERANLVAAYNPFNTP